MSWNFLLPLLESLALNVALPLLEKLLPNVPADIWAMVQAVLNDIKGLPTTLERNARATSIKSAVDNHLLSVASKPQ